MSIVHLIIGVPDFDLYALVSCLSPMSPSTVLVSLFSMTARPPLFPSVLYDLGRLVCTFQISCRYSGPLGRVAPHLPTPCLADPADSRPPACLQLGFQLFPICKCSLDALGHGSALASHLSTNVSQYAVDALSCRFYACPPTCLQLGPPASARVLWVFWAAQFYTCVPIVSLASDCFPICHGCSALFPDCLHGYFGCSVPHEHLSPPCLLLSPNKLWVLWAACFLLVFYCLTVRCSVGALSHFLFSFVSCLSPSVPYWAISEAAKIVGFVGASLEWQKRAFHLFPRVSHLLHKSVCDFVGVLVAQLVSRLSCVADRLPVVIRFPAGPRVSLKW